MIWVFSGELYYSTSSVIFSGNKNTRIDGSTAFFDLSISKTSGRNVTAQSGTAITVLNNLKVNTG